MIYQFPCGEKAKEDPKEEHKEDELHVRLDVTFDVPDKIAEQLDLVGVNGFDYCYYDRHMHRVIAGMKTTFYRREA